MQSGEAKRIRKAAGLSQVEVAAVCGGGQDRISCWERALNKPNGEAGYRYARLIARLAAEQGS